MSKGNIVYVVVNWSLVAAGFFLNSWPATIVWWLVTPNVWYYIYLLIRRYRWRQDASKPTGDVKIEVVTDDYLFRTFGALGGLAISSERRVLLTEATMTSEHANFIVAHELGHVAAGHSLYSSGVEVLVRELVADQCAVAATSREEAIAALTEFTLRQKELKAPWIYRHHNQTRLWFLRWT